MESHVNDKSKYLKTNTKIAMQKVVQASPMARPCQIRRGANQILKGEAGPVEPIHANVRAVQRFMMNAQIECLKDKTAGVPLRDIGTIAQFFDRQSLKTRLAMHLDPEPATSKHLDWHEVVVLSSDADAGTSRFWSVICG